MYVSDHIHPLASGSQALSTNLLIRYRRSLLNHGKILAILYHYIIITMWTIKKTKHACALQQFVTNKRD